MSTIYKRFLFSKICTSAAENLDLRLEKHQQVCLLNECSGMEAHLCVLARTSLITIMFLRFCMTLAIKVDLGLSSKQLLCLFKECINIAQHYNDKNAMKDAIINFVTISRCVTGYEGQNECEQTIVFGKKCIDIGEEMGDKLIESDACYVVGKAFLWIKKYQDAVLYFKKTLDLAEETCNRKVAKYEDAVASWKNCTKVATETGSRNIEMYAHLEIGRAYAQLKQYEDVIISCKKCIAIAKEIGDRMAEMYGYFELGKVYEQLLQYEDANVYCNDCVEMAKEIGDRIVEMKAYCVLEKTHAHLGQHSDAISYGTKCIDIAKHIGDKKTEEHAGCILVKIYADLQQYDEAISYGRKWIELAKEIGLKSIELDAYLVVAQVLYKAGQNQESIKYSKRGLEISNETCDSEAEMISLSLLAYAHAQLRHHEDAILFSKRCIDLAKSMGNKMVEVQTHKVLVHTYTSLSQLNQALLHLNEGKKIARELNLDKSLNGFKEWQHLLNVIVGIYNQLFPDEQIIAELIDIPNGPEQDFLDAIDEAMKTKDVKELSLALMRHHCFCYSQKEYEKSLTSLKHLTLMLTEIDIETKLWCDMVIIKLYMLMEQNNQAQAYCWEILNEMKENGNRVLQSLFYSRFGQLLYDDRQLGASEKYLREALRCFEIVFASLGSNDELKISIVDKYCACCKCLSLVLNATNQVEEALSVSDSCRARALKDLLVSNFGVHKETNEEEQIKCSDIQAFAASSYGFTLLFYSLFDNAVMLFCSNTKEKEFNVSLLLIKVKNGTGFLSLLDEVFEEIDAHEVNQCENRSLDPKQKNMERRDEENKSILCDALLGMNVSHADYDAGPESRGATSGDLNAHGNALHFLSMILLHPVKDILDQDEIVIIPDGQLNCVPFAALCDLNTGKYLSETKRIRLAPSIATLKALQERSADQHHKKGALIIGSPLVGKVMMHGEVREIELLFGALDEAIGIARILGVKPLVAADATKPAVLEKLREGASVVHIAAHGILSKATIVLAPSREVRATKIPDEEDYMLTMADVQQAQVSAQLVVLSCCHSGRGEIRAEGVVGMCRAFLASGARAVVASLWAIDDDATLEFMKTFYEHLRNGNSASRSLQLTMNDMRQSERFNEPKYWAPFFLIGDDVTIDFTH